MADTIGQCMIARILRTRYQPVGAQMAAKSPWILLPVKRFAGRKGCPQMVWTRRLTQSRIQSGEGTVSFHTCSPDLQNSNFYTHDTPFQVGMLGMVHFLVVLANSEGISTRTFTTKLKLQNRVIVSDVPERCALL